MTIRELVQKRPATINVSEAMEETGCESEALAIVNINDALEATSDLIARETFRIDNDLVYSLWWREQKPHGYRLLDARTNLNGE